MPERRDKIVQIVFAIWSQWDNKLGLSFKQKFSSTWRPNWG